MIVRPTIYPDTTQFSIVVFGERGRMLVKASVRYTAVVDGADRTIEAILTPGRIPRQRRHLWDGVMVLSDADGERKVVDFLHYWEGDWVDDLRILKRRSEVAFIVDGIPRARGAGVHVDVDPSFLDIMSSKQMRVTMEVQIKSDCILVQSDPYVGDDPVDYGSLIEAASKGRKWVTSEGKVVKVDDEVDLKLVAESSGKVSAVPWENKASILGTLRMIRDSRIDERMKPVVKRIVSAEPEEKLPVGLRANLRHYQVEGYKWLKKKISSGSGCIIADQMGTGKTLQTISAYMAMKEADPGYRVLVLAPKSLMGNWLNEFQKFAPSVNVLVWQGPNRKRYADMLPQVDAVVAPYEIFKIDYDFLSKFPFHAAFFDEAQVLKNADTASHKAAIRCLAPVRVAMTGTPVENRLEDMHSIMSIACPGLLPPLKEFKEKVAKPLKEGDPTAARIMATQIKPFIIRRTKAEVATDLPPKIITNQLCPMTDVQERFYTEALDQAMEEKENALSSGDRRGLSSLYLKLVLRLRQIAVDPRLADPTGRYRPEDSGKIVTLRGIMDDLDQDDANKVLIFSQWVEELKLVQQELEARKQKFSFLTGETKDRDGEVHNFQTQDSVRYFLLGLKSGGVGLNITAANTVIFMDPWWNPAAEAQAEDRAHRIGQKRTVNVYRLISQGTIEERVADMKEVKQAIADGAVGDKPMPEMDMDTMSKLIG